MEFYACRNKSKRYSVKLYKSFLKELTSVTKQPETGKRTEIETIRGLVVNDYIIFYEFDSERLVVLTIWDCRQNPDNLLIR